MEFQKVDLYKPIAADKKGPAPLVLRVAVQNADMYTTGGTYAAPIKSEAYVLLSALPADIRSRVETAVQALISGML